MNKRILIVEDESLLALAIADQLRDAGYEVVGPATSVAKAQKLIQDIGCDAAVLDVNLGNETVTPVALALRALGVPFLLLSGNSRTQLPEELQNALWLSKPVLAKVLLAALHQSVGSQE